MAPAAFLLCPSFPLTRPRTSFLSPVLTQRLHTRLRPPPTASALREPPLRTSPPPPSPSPVRTVPPPPPLHRFWPRLLLLAVAAVWGTNFATVKLLQSGLHPLPLPVAALSRFSLAALFLAPLAHRQTLSRAPTPACLRDSLSIGLAISLGYFAQSLSLLSTEANKSAFICSLAVVLVPLFERAARHLNLSSPARKPRDETPLVTWGAPLLAVLGVGLLELGGTSPPCEGDAWALLQATGFALGFIGNANAAAKYPGLLLFITTVQLATVAAFSAVWAVVDASAAAHSFAFPDLATVFASPENALGVVYAGIVTTALTVWLENIALVHVSAGELAVLLSTEPFWAAAFSAATLGESMGPQAVVGGMVILAACLLNQSKGVDVGQWLRKQSGLAANLSPMFSFVHMFLWNGMDPPSS